MAEIHELPIQYYIKRLEDSEYFTFAGYSDAEWFSIIKHQIGNTTGLGQIIDEETGERLLSILVRRQRDPDFLFAVPKCLWVSPYFMLSGIPLMIESTLDMFEVSCPFYERDMVTDELAKNGELFPLIDQLQKMNVVIIGNKHLRELGFLHYTQFIEISSPNLHMEESGVENAVDSAKKYGQSAVYLVSAGVSAALIIDQLYGHIIDSFFVDCGSIWDTFVGIGSQREWRRKLYSNPKALEKWRHDNLCGKES